jgi:cellulose synthase (UDP-forming)
MDSNGKPYYLNFENRVPEAPLTVSVIKTTLFQILSLVFILFGLVYLNWRWGSSLNKESLWFSLPLVIAETFSFIGALLLIFNYWENRDPVKKLPVRFLSDIRQLNHGEHDRPLNIDVFIASYNEEINLLRYTIRDAKKARYPFEDVTINIFLLDDGKRDGRNPDLENLKKLAAEEGIRYFVRETNEGHKAGNLNNAFYQTNGDLIVILDADTRPFPDFLINTTGYFRDHRLAWVQTPQWFYDLTESVPVSDYLKKSFGTPGKVLGKLIAFPFGKLRTGKDIFGNDPKLFYDIILRRRNRYNASFCCGAGSVHRRDALVGVKEQLETENTDSQSTWFSTGNQESQVKEVKPIADVAFVPHISEDLYTSLLIHNSHVTKWKSLVHPEVECKMLSPQDLDSWVKQRSRYATGSLDIFFSKNNPLMLKSLTWAQKISYFTTMYAYFAPFWLLVFLVSPIVFFFTLTPPVMAFNFDFFKYFIPFMLLNVTVFTIGTWGIDTTRSEQYYLSSFWMNIKSFFHVIGKHAMQFSVTEKNRHITKNMMHIVPHLIIMSLTFCGILYNLILIIKGVHPSYSAFTANAIWGTYNIYQLSAFVRAAFWKH